MLGGRADGLSKVWLLPVLFAVLLLLLGIGSRYTYVPAERKFAFDPPHAVTGDEPHYILVTNSILFDHDLLVGDDYERVRAGGWQAGRLFRGVNLDHHSIFVDPRTGEHELWPRIFDPGRPEPCPADTTGCVGFHRVDPRFPVPSRLLERSAHPVAFPAILAALVAPTMPRAGTIEDRVGLAIVFCSWLGVLLTYLVARRVGLERRWALIAAGLLLASPWLVYSRSFFAEPLLGLVLIAALGAQLSRRPIATAALLFTAAAIKPPFLLIGAAWFLHDWMIGRRVEALAFARTLGGGLAVMAGFNYLQASTVLVAGNLGWTGVTEWRNSFGTLVHASYGLLWFVPWTFLPLGALLPGLRPSGPERAVLRAIGLAVAPLLVMFMAHAYLGQTCYGPRYWVPLLPMLGIATAVFLRARARTGRWLGASLACVSAIVAVTGWIQYPNMWDKPAYTALASMVRSRSVP